MLLGEARGQLGDGGGLAGAGRADQGDHAAGLQRVNRGDRQLARQQAQHQPAATVGFGVQRDLHGHVAGDAGVQHHGIQFAEGRDRLVDHALGAAATVGRGHQPDGGSTAVAALARARQCQARVDAGQSNAMARDRQQLRLEREHSAASLALAFDRGLSYAVLGAVHATASHPGQSGMGWAQFQALVQAARLPVFAIGGLASSDLRMAQQQGAHGVAMLSQFK